MIEISIKTNAGWKTLDVDQQSIQGSFVMSLKSTDYDDPTSIFTNYSKTIEIPLTNNNKKILNFVNRTDSIISGKKQYNCIINNNGLLLDKGFIVIESTDNYNAYVTFYSDLCLFFKNLSENENGDERKMHELKLGFNDSEYYYNGNIYLSSQYLAESWDKLRTGPYDATDVLKNITLCPTYGGYYDDFDSEKVLLWDPTSNSYIADRYNITATSTTYTGNYALFNAPRELASYEIRDFRATRQNIAVKTKCLLDAISSPENNGGYEIIWDEDFSNGGHLDRIYNNSWTILDPPVLDNHEGLTIDLSNELLVFGDSLTNFNVKEFNNGELIDLSGLRTKRLNINMTPNIYLMIPENNQTLRKYLCFNLDKYDICRAETRYGGLVLQCNVYDENDNFLNTTNTWITTVNENDKYYKDFTLTAEDFLRRYNNHFQGTPYAMDIAVELALLTADTQTIEYQQDGDVELMYKPNKKKFWKVDVDVDKVRIEYKYLFIGYWEDYDIAYMSGEAGDYDFEGTYLGSYPVNGIARTYDTNHYTRYNSDKYTQSKLDTLNLENTKIYDSNRVGGFADAFSIEEILAGLKCSPKDYLLSFTKLLNLKFLYEDEKIYILTSEHFYDKIGIDINDDIDRTSMSVVINYHDKKYYDYKYHDTETWVEYITEKKTGSEVNTVRVITDNIGSETCEPLEDTIWTTCLPYVMSSPYLNSYSLMYSPLLAGTSWEYESMSGPNNESTTYTYVMTQNESADNYDIYDRLCCFNKNYDPVDELVSLQFLSGWEERNNDINWIATDYISVMEEFAGK